MLGCGTEDFPAGFLGPLTSNVGSFVKNLSVIFDYKQKFDCQNNSVLKNSSDNLRLLSEVKVNLAHRDLQTVIHDFINTQLDYSNLLYSGLDHSLLHYLQLVQKAAAHLLSGQHKCDHMSQLHCTHSCCVWILKILLLVFSS